MLTDLKHVFSCNPLYPTYRHPSGELQSSSPRPLNWKAFEEGRQIDVLRANHALCAVAMPAGDDRIVYAHDPPSFKLGVFITLLGAALIVAFCAAARTRG
jgi:uncharacterized membrane protein YfhO